MAFKRPHYAVEVQDFLQNRATPEEAHRVQRFMSLIQQAAGVPAEDAPSTHRPCASAPMGVPSRQQQRLQRLSMATDTDSAAPGGGNSNSSWLYTTTAAASTMRPGSAQVLSTHQISAAAAAKPKHKAFRPASAAAPASPNNSTANPTGCNYSPDASHTPAKPAGAAQLPGRARSAGLKSVNITTSQAMHGLKDLYPDLWASTVPICRPDPAPNKNFISEWGESLRQGAGEAWKPYLATTSQLANLQVAKPTDEFAVRADEALIGWVAKQHTHFADLLLPQAEAAVAAMLEGRAAAGGSRTLSLSERKEMLQVLRQLAAVVQPDRAKSTSQVLHCKQTSVEEASTTSLLKELTRIRTMGFPRKVTVKGFRPLSSTAALASVATHSTSGSIGSGRVQSAAAGGSSTGGRKAAVRASEMIDTQKSKVPLKWAASTLVPPSSTYTSTHGAHPGRSPQMFRTKFREVNVGMGHVDQHLYPPGSQVYPVESLYLELPAKCRPQAPDVKTTYRASFPSASSM